MTLYHSWNNGILRRKYRRLMSGTAISGLLGLTLLLAPILESLKMAKAAYEGAVVAQILAPLLPDEVKSLDFTHANTLMSLKKKGGEVLELEVEGGERVLKKLVDKGAKDIEFLKTPYDKFAAVRYDLFGEWKAVVFVMGLSKTEGRKYT